MTAIAQHSRPSWARLVGIQFMLILESGRWIELIGGVLAMLALSILTLWGAASTAPRMGLLAALPKGLALSAGLVVILMGGWPALLWRGEPARGRRYHWSLPVSHGSHDLARVAAGGIWVVIAGMLLELIRVLALPSLGPGASLVYASYASYVLGLVVIYALASIPALVSRHPARWFYGVLIGYVLLLWSVSDKGPVLPGDHPIVAPLFGRYGFVAAVGGNAFAMIVADPIHESAVSQTIRIHHLIRSDAALASALWIAGAIAVMLAISRSWHEHQPDTN